MLPHLTVSDQHVGLCSPRHTLPCPTLPYMLSGYSDEVEEEVAGDVAQKEAKEEVASPEIEPAPSASVRLAPSSAPASGHLCQVIGLCQANMDEHADVT